MKANLNTEISANPQTPGKLCEVLGDTDGLLTSECYFLDDSTSYETCTASETFRLSR
ncbi:MAG: hypothetical protein ABI361_12955 [Nitrososphaera sp.]|jgi:hypothetical protein